MSVSCSKKKAGDAPKCEKHVRREGSFTLAKQSPLYAPSYFCVVCAVELTLKGVELVGVGAKNSKPNSFLTDFELSKELAPGVAGDVRNLAGINDRASTIFKNLSFQAQNLSLNLQGHLQTLKKVQSYIAQSIEAKFKMICQVMAEACNELQTKFTAEIEENLRAIRNTNFKFKKVENISFLLAQQLMKSPSLPNNELREISQ